jgi:hypothetical protein
LGEGIRDYVRLFFLKKYDELREQAAGGAQPNLSGGMIRLTRVPLPSLTVAAYCRDPQRFLTQLLVNLSAAPISRLSDWLLDRWKL